MKSGELHFSKLELISVSTPYMLHLHPVTIPSSVSDTPELESTRLDNTDTFEGSVKDGMEHIFNTSTQLRYGCDLRLNEVHFIFYVPRLLIPIELGSGIII